MHLGINTSIMTAASAAAAIMYNSMGKQISFGYFAGLSCRISSSSSRTTTFSSKGRLTPRIS